MFCVVNIIHESGNGFNSIGSDGVMSLLAKPGKSIEYLVALKTEFPKPFWVIGIESPCDSMYVFKTGFIYLQTMLFKLSISKKSPCAK